MHVRRIEIVTLTAVKTNEILGISTFTRIHAVKYAFPGSVSTNSHLPMNYLEVRACWKRDKLGNSGE